MKYWLFDGKDAQGPFEAEQLKALPGFGPQTLICPDGAESADQWRPSQHYLIKPPPTKAEPARSARQPAGTRSGGMGRIADAGLADEAPAPVAPPQRQPLPARRRVSTGAVIAAAAAMASAAGAYCYLNFYQHPKPATAASAPAAEPAPATAPAAPPVPALTDSQVSDATTFVQDFKTQSPGRRLPMEASAVFSPRRWKSAQTVGEALAMESLLPLDNVATSVLEKQGLGFKAGERELRASGKRWAAYSERFLRAVAPLSWDVKRSHNCPTQSAANGEPTCFEVTALLRAQRDGPQEPHAFVADLTARALKPLDSSAWLDLDPKGLAAWAKTHVAFGEPLDEEAVAAQAPVYGIPLEHHKHMARHAPVIPQPEPAQASDDDLGPPTPKDAHAAPAQDDSDQGLDYTEPASQKPAGGQPAAPAQEGGSDEQILEKALLQGNAAASGTAPSGNGSAAGARNSAPPGLDHSVSAAPQAQPPAPAQPAPASGGGEQPAAAPANGANGNGKSAMDMSVDELNQYLKREGGSTP